MEHSAQLQPHFDTPRAWHVRCVHPSGFREEGREAGSATVCKARAAGATQAPVGATGAPVHVSLHFSPNT